MSASTSICLLSRYVLTELQLQSKDHLTLTPSVRSPPQHVLGDPARGDTDQDLR
jgi:hypothetical protein